MYIHGELFTGLAFFSICVYRRSVSDVDRDANATGLQFLSHICSRTAPSLYDEASAAFLGVSDMDERSVWATAVSSNTIRSEWVSSRGTPAPYGVVSHHCMPFLLLYTTSVHYINIVCNALFKV